MRNLYYLDTGIDERDSAKIAKAIGKDFVRNLLDSIRQIPDKICITCSTKNHSIANSSGMTG